ncbi:transcription antiterminator LicT [Heyndrickxia sporothermodurans]|uniref:BglG family transcription antiterminator LicT n=1 Tax=Heyndrickxia sporothermodurans TaxID=46224 RepID=UPI000D392911|nr:PRD domain-containing protein [Heyndrickxia sporothermodurans]PTY79258.1 transcription antiterminator LicT [Heyndrickxia sporothermodurans]
MINNNIVIVEDADKNEMILAGKGIGFQKKAGDIVEAKNIEKRFLLEDKGLYDKFKKLVKEIPVETIRISDDLISKARRELKKALSENIYLSLPDHINMAIYRFSKGQNVSNMLLWEIKRMYPREFEIGLYGLELIRKQYDLELPEDEAGFIAIHFVNAQLNEGMNQVFDMTKFLKEVLRIIEYHFKISLYENSLNYFRFVTHLRFFAQRVFNHTVMSDKDRNLYDIVKSNYPDSYVCVEKINTLIQTNYSHTISVDEKLYLMLHINRIIQREEN